MRIWFEKAGGDVCGAREWPVASTARPHRRLAPRGRPGIRTSSCPPRVSLCARGGCVAVGWQAEESSQFGMRGNGEVPRLPGKAKLRMAGFPSASTGARGTKPERRPPWGIRGYTRRGNAGWCLAMSGPPLLRRMESEKTRGPPRRSKRVRAPVPKSDEVEAGLLRRARRRQRIATWLILPVVICLSQRLSHACVSINSFVL